MTAIAKGSGEVRPKRRDRRHRLGDLRGEDGLWRRPGERRLPGEIS